MSLSNFKLYSRDVFSLLKIENELNYKKEFLKMFYDYGMNVENIISNNEGWFIARYYKIYYPKDKRLEYAINIRNHRLIVFFLKYKIRIENHKTYFDENGDVLAKRYYCKPDKQTINHAIYQCHTNADFSTFEFLSILNKNKERKLSPEDIVDYEIKDLACIVDKKYKLEEDSMCNTGISTFLYHEFYPIVWYLLCRRKNKLSLSSLKHQLMYMEHNGDLENADKLYLKLKTAFSKKY